MGYIPPPSEAVIGGIPFRTVGMNDTGAYYQQAGGAAGISTALNQAQTDQNTLFFLIWILAATTPYQVDAQLKIMFSSAQIWGTGSPGSGVTSATVLQPVAGMTGDMWSWQGSGPPGSIDIKFLQFDGSNLSGTPITGGASGGVIYTNASGSNQLVVMTDPSGSITGSQHIIYTQSATGGPTGNGPGTRTVQCAFDQLTGTNPPKAGSMLLGPGDSLTFTYTGASWAASGITMASSTLNSFLNISVANSTKDNTHPIDIYEVNCVQCQSVTTAIFIYGCQEAYFGRVFVNGANPASGLGGASYIWFDSKGGSCWFSECNVTGYLLHGLTIVITGGNIGATGVWVFKDASGDTTNCGIMFVGTHWDGPAMVPMIMWDSPVQGRLNFVSGSPSNGKNITDGFISGQHPTLAYVAFSGLVQFVGGTQHHTPLHAPTAGGGDPALGIAIGPAFMNDGETLAFLMANTSYEGLYVSSSGVATFQSLMMATFTSTASGINPVATSSPTQKLMGLSSATNGWNRTFTPLRPSSIGTSTLKVTLIFSCSEATLADISTLQLWYGTGAAPENGTTGGTAFSAPLTHKQQVAGDATPVCLVASIPGLTTNTAYWIDLGAANSGSHATTITVAQVTVEETFG